ncbi:hypothetical protein [Dictyobacter kobayashii]|uniref:hypothetical protein n=1 Tax=Dictyobacter kobayashii TaxID=2014872 RepID=UPI000F837336|nr:hypothetical protein [Dictyobacter kobayashii]
MWIRIDELREGETEKRYLLEYAWNKPLVWSYGWYAQSVDIQVPEDSVYISLGLILLGKSQVWLDLLEFEAVG